MRAPILPKNRLVVLLVFASLSAWASDGGFSSLEERMSYKEFKEYGLDHLTPEQLRGLNQWLQAHGGSAAPGLATIAPAANAPASRPSGEPADGAQIVSRIAGDFNGWQQGTILALENGQRWEVRDDETVYAHDNSHPRVTVEQGGLIGGWRLSVEGHSDMAHVVPVTAR